MSARESVHEVRQACPATSATVTSDSLRMTGAIDSILVFTNGLVEHFDDTAFGAQPNRQICQAGRTTRHVHTKHARS